MIIQAEIINIDKIQSATSQRYISHQYYKKHEFNEPVTKEL